MNIERAKPVTLACLLTTYKAHSDDDVLMRNSTKIVPWRDLTILRPLHLQCLRGAGAKVRLWSDF